MHIFIASSYDMGLRISYLMMSPYDEAYSDSPQDVMKMEKRHLYSNF